MIRLAEIADIPRMTELGQVFFYGTILPQITSYNATSMSFMLRELIEGDNSVALVLLRDDVIVGGIGGYLLSSYFNHEVTFAQQVFWFVHPEYRSLKSLKLLDAFTEWSEANGADVIFSGAKNDANYQGMQSMLNRRGFAPLETVFVKGV